LALIATLSPDEAAKVLAEASGLTVAEARMRLAPEPPALLARLETAKAESLVADLRRTGLAGLAVDAQCPTDRDRIVVHCFSLGDTWLTLSPRSGPSVRLMWTDIAAVLRGVRASQVDVERTEETTTYIPTMDGYPMVYTSTNTVRSSNDSSEQVIFVYLRDGRSALLAANGLAFTCLGPAMQPSASGNMAELARLLRERAKEAFYDERLLKLGRRPLPFGVDSQSRSGTAKVVTTRSSTVATLDVLAEVMWQASAEGLLP
jgi:hypothetical protein